MKTKLKILILLITLASCRERKETPFYTVKQKVYSNQGKDSVKTQVFFWKSDLYGKQIYVSADELSLKADKNREATRFIETHKTNR